MKMLDDIFSSITGNAKIRISDPFIGTFIVTWFFCNWNHLALLVWGEGSATKRINEFYKYLTEWTLTGVPAIFLLPLGLTIIYLLGLPWLSFFVKFLQKHVNGKLHQQTVDIYLSKLVQQEELNKASLRSNPNKKFLEQIVQIEIDRKREIFEQIKQRTERFKAKTLAASATAAEAESKAKIAQLDVENKQMHSDIERQRFSVRSAVIRAALASHRFPSAYLFMSLIENSVKDDEVTLSLTATGEIVAAIFGYENFQSLIDDEKFNNKTLSDIKYVYYETNELANRLEQVVLNENSENEDLTADLLFSHVQMIFENLEYDFVTLKVLEELSLEFCDENKYEILNAEGASGAIAESDTIFEDIQIDDVDSAAFDNGFTALVCASASGHHRKESDIGGRDMNIQIDVKSKVLLGKFALGAFELDEINASLVDYNDDSELTGEEIEH